jgi:hypothetical protein
MPTKPQKRPCRDDRAKRRRCPVPSKATGKVKVAFLGKAGGKRVHLVDGRKLRDHVDIDFVAGGNGARYGYVPDGEIWVERGTPARERAAVILHELVEEREMRNRRQTYGQGHRTASAVEGRFRSEGGTRTSSNPTGVAARAFSRWKRERQERSRRRRGRR